MKKHKVYLKMCQDLSNISKCAKHKVGALILKNDRIISNGLNGSPKGFTNCCDKFHGIDTHSEPGKSLHRDWAEKFEIHAEMNAILYANRCGTNLEDSILYCNLEPCYNCLKHAVTVGIKEIYYANKHKSNLESQEALDLINQLGIKIEYIKLD